MPTRRGSVDLADLVDIHEESLINLIEVIEHVTSDGLIEPGEHQLLRTVMRHSRQTLDPIPARASEQDDAFRCIGAIAGAGRVTTRHVRSLIREAGTDAERGIA